MKTCLVILTLNGRRVEGVPDSAGGTQAGLEPFDAVQGSGADIAPGLAFGRGRLDRDAVADGGSGVTDRAAQQRARQAKNDRAEAADDQAVAAVLKRAERIAAQIEGVDVRVARPPDRAASMVEECRPAALKVSAS